MSLHSTPSKFIYLNVNSTKRSTKKEKIFQLLLKKIPPEEIAVEVETSLEYVYKLSSKFNRRNESVQLEQLESISGTKNELIIPGQANLGVNTDPNIMQAPNLGRTLTVYY